MWYILYLPLFHKCKKYSHGDHILTYIIEYVTEGVSVELISTGRIYTHSLITGKMETEFREFVVFKDGVLLIVSCLLLHSIIWYADGVNNTLSILV